MKPPPIPVRPVSIPIKKPIDKGARILMYSFDFLYLNHHAYRKLFDFIY